ncbi:uncharacterized protein LOC128675527 isoform X2 [Plodia interpunctella]|uniref:uncharacterized protein LOC128675527 isoform X2 n=1 Tax=Plodia interpunctella TaxID=58824 RepID=UPI002367809C|nr:uncharacterized protein LOC128675527 isoform X2 [Plodia interpunctella]XP_053610964.1 uncharacterized protein LOC128675527 isoform X2 [Plodia interpunctella]
MDRVSFVTSRKSFISHRDKNCDQEDPRILEELKRRSNHDNLIRAFKPFKILPEHINPRVQRPHPVVIPMQKLNQTTVAPPGLTPYRRKYEFGTKRHKKYSNRDVPERASRHKMIEIVEQAIYGAQYRLKDVEPIVNKYVDLAEFRISFIFKRMETIELELEYIYSHMYNAGHLWDAWSGAKMRVFLYIVYYEMVLMKNVDVQYMVDLLFKIHEEEQRKMAEYLKQSSINNNSGIPSNTTGLPWNATGPGSQTWSPGQTFPPSAG